MSKHCLGSFKCQCGKVSQFLGKKPPFFYICSGCGCRVKTQREQKQNIILDAPKRYIKKNNFMYYKLILVVLFLGFCAIVGFQIVLNIFVRRIVEDCVPENVCQQYIRGVNEY